MKYIQMQPDVVLVNGMTGEEVKDNGEPATFSFEQFILSRLCDAQFGRNMESIFQAIKIRKQLEAADGYLELEDVDHAVLLNSVKSPSPETPYNAVVAASFAPFMEAIAGALSNRPDPEQVEDESATEPAPDDSSQAEQPVASVA